MSFNMKNTKSKILSTLLLTGMLLTAPGCYTILWTPDENMNEERLQSSSSETSSPDVEVYTNYYPVERFGGYGGYYNIPWWTKVNLPPAAAVIKTRDNGSSNASAPSIDEGRDARDIRNVDLGRVSGGGAASGSSGAAASGSSSSSGNERTRNTTTEVNKTSGNSSNNSTPSNSRDNRTGDSNSLRNSDSNRSTDKGRR